MTPKILNSFFWIWLSKIRSFLHFSQQFRNQRKILYFFDTHIQTLWFLGHIRTLKPNSQETAQNFEKGVLQKFLRITFYTYVLVNPYHFIKKHHNRCTLLQVGAQRSPCGPVRGQVRVGGEPGPGRLLPEGAGGQPPVWQRGLGVPGHGIQLHGEGYTHLQPGQASCQR